MRPKESKTKQQTCQFVRKMYIDACRRAINSDTIEGEQDHKTYIITQLQSLGVPYKKINEIISYNKNDFIADLLEVTEDMKIVIKNQALSAQKFENRSRSHFGGINYDNLQKDRRERPTAKVLKMYQNNSRTWNQQKQLAFEQRVFPASVYLMGISKGNGAIIGKNCIVSCAHVFVDQQNNKLMKIRCFSNAVGGYGIVRLHQSGIIKQTDMCFAQIMHYEGPEVPSIMPCSASLKFASQFTPLACLQVGLLYFSDENYLSTFQTAEGFIERNEYQNAEDRELYKEQMGKLIHNCFGMWGTSGSPLWSADGQLLGLHNSWNEKGYNVSMIVHEDEKYKKSDSCWVVRQYQRRAVSIHVIEHYYKKWKNTLQDGKQYKWPIQDAQQLIETKKRKRIKKENRQ